MTFNQLVDDSSREALRHPAEAIFEAIQTGAIFTKALPLAVCPHSLDLGVGPVKLGLQVTSEGFPLGSGCNHI